MNKQVIENIFETLNSEKICYAVCVAKTQLRLKNSIDSSNYVDRDYFIIASAHEKGLNKKHKKGCKKKNKFLYGFHQTQNDIHVIGRTMNETEIRYFKELQDDFIKVSHSSDGRIYELKNNPFKKHYEKLKGKYNEKRDEIEKPV